jgi:DNA gyrase subunit A
MSTEKHDTTQFASEVVDRRFVDEMQDSYIDYAMSVIAGRALPDARDGLKPVHRRILYTMHEQGLKSTGGHRKSSSIVGETMGNYHPHGDSAIYETLVRLGQDFSMGYPLVDGQGNFGSIDGDAPAADRYTEARMTALTEEMLADINKETVDFEANYDGRLTEPTVLPASFPNLLVNGSEGIAVGMSTSIPPHNLSEVVDATIHLIQNPDATIEGLMEYVKGPDFPTGATIVGREAIKNGYETGRARLRVRAKYDIEEMPDGFERLVITEVPYQENKARLIERIAEDVNEGRITGIRDLRDESNREGIKMVIDLKRDAIADVVANQLIERHLEVTYSLINLALVDGQPLVLNLKEMLEVFVDHRMEVVTRRTQKQADEAGHRSHILEGRLLALEHVDEVVEIIRAAADRTNARAELEKVYGFSEDQSNHIVSMQLGSLTSLEATGIQSEFDDLQKELEWLENILENESVLRDLLTDELSDLKQQYGEERRTEIVEDMGSIQNEDLIPREDIYIVFTDNGYIKRLSDDVVGVQNRGGKGIKGTDLKQGDSVSAIRYVNTHEWLFFLTNQGNIYKLKGYEIPEMSRNARGRSVVRLLNLSDDEEVRAVVRAGEIDESEYLTVLSEQGYIKRTQLSEFANINSSGIRAVKLEEGDELVGATITKDDGDLLVATAHGQAIRFDEDDVRPMGRTARGVRGVKLRDDDVAIGFVDISADHDGCVLTVTKNGYGKRTGVDEYRQQSRNGVGLINIKQNDRNGGVAQVLSTRTECDFVLMSRKGKMMRLESTDISKQGRNTQGVRVMRLDGNDTIASMEVIPATAGEN